MKILYVCPLLPYLRADHASSFMTWRLLRHLSKRHEVTVVSFSRSGEEAERAADLREFCRDVRALPLPESPLDKLQARMRMLAMTPLAIAQAYSGAMRDELRALQRQERFDVVHFEYTSMGAYERYVEDCPKVLSAPDLVAATADKCLRNLPPGRKRVEWLIDSLIGLRYEAQLCARFDKVLTVSSALRDLLLSKDPGLDVEVLPIGVDVPAAQKSHGAGKGRSIIFMGAMWRQENVDAITYFYHSAFDRVCRIAPEAKLRIVGGSPTEEILKLRADPRVEVTGFVEDLLPYYLQSDVSIAPVRIAGGVMCKVLDAMAAGLPVVATSFGNAGVGAAHGAEMLIADDPERFAEHVAALLLDGRLRQDIGERGARFVRRRFAWDAVIARLEGVYEESLRSRMRKEAGK